MHNKKFILKCLHLCAQTRKGKYYVGKTIILISGYNNILIVKEYGLENTNQLEELVGDCDDYDEDKITQQYMD